MEPERLKAIETDEEYRARLEELEPLMLLDPSPNSPEGGRLMQLAIAIELWERDHYPMREAQDD